MVDEPALVAVLADSRIAAARIDCTVEEPLPVASPLWGLDNALITPHTAGETRSYEDNVIDQRGVGRHRRFDRRGITPRVWTQCGLKGGGT